MNPMRMQEVLKKLMDPKMQAKLQPVVTAASNRIVQGGGEQGKVVASCKMAKITDITIEDDFLSSAPVAVVEDEVQEAVNAALDAHQEAILDAIDAEIPGYKEVVEMAKKMTEAMGGMGGMGMGGMPGLPSGLGGGGGGGGGDAGEGEKKKSSWGSWFSERN